MPPQPAFDPGLTQQFGGKLRRVINKDGSFNVHRGEEFSSANLYLTIINMPWAWFSVLIVISYLVVNTLFACVYLMLGPDALAARPPHSNLERFATAFFFSAQTITTVGYGQVAPLNFAASAVAAFEAMVGLLGFALATGLMYGRVSRPSARLVFSPSLLLAPFADGVSLQFRIANRRRNQLVDVEATVLLMTVETEGATTKRRFTQLPLERTAINFLPLTWTIVHPIDDHSPFWGKNPRELERLQAELLVLIRAYDDTFSQTVHARYSYRHEEIVWGAKFLPAFSVDAGGDLVLELHKINDHQPADLPQQQA